MYPVILELRGNATIPNGHSQTSILAIVFLLLKIILKSSWNMNGQVGKKLYANPVMNLALTIKRMK